jgi:putative phage-type endonuclease
MTRDEWLAERKKGIGASEIAGVMGLCGKWVTPHSLWLEKTGREEREETLAMRMGKHMEPFILDEFLRLADRDNLNITNVVPGDFYRDEALPHIFCTTDFECDWDGEPAIIETKFANDYAADSFGQKGSDQVPDQYVVQVVYQMAVRRRHKAILAACLSNRELAYYGFTATPELRTLMATARRSATDFWNNHVLPDVPPNLTGYEPDTRYVKETYSYEDGSIVAADKYHETLMRERLVLKQLIEGNELRRCEIDNLLKEYMGEAAVLESDAGVLTWKADKNGRRNFREGKAVLV